MAEMTIIRKIGRWKTCHSANSLSYRENWATRPVRKV